MSKMPQSGAPLNRVHRACPMECYFSVYSIGVKFTTVTAKFTPPALLNRVPSGCSTGVKSSKAI